MTHKAKKVVIITEKLILDRVLELLEDAGATPGRGHVAPRP